MGKNKNSKRKYTKFLESWFNHPSIRIAMYLALGAIMYLLLIGQVIPETHELVEGQISPIRLESPITVVDEWATNNLRDAAANAVPDQFTREEKIVVDQTKFLDDFFNSLNIIVVQTELTPEEKAQLLALSADLSLLTEETKTALASLSLDKVNNLKFIVRTTLDAIMNENIKLEDLEASFAKVDERVENNPFDNEKEIKNLASEITKSYIKPNYFYNSNQTSLLREEARNSVEQVLIKKDDLIVKVGQTIDKAIYEKLKAASLLKDTSTLWPYFGLLLLVGLLLVLLFYSIERMKPSVHKENKALSMVLIIVLLTLVGISIIGFIGESSETLTMGYLAPVAFGVMLITLFVSMKFAILIAVVFSMYASIVFNTDLTMIFDFRYGFVLLIGSTAGAFAIGRVKQRSSILKAGLIIALFNVLSILVILMLTNQTYTLKNSLESVSFGLIGGLFSAVLTIGFMPFFETVFGILSPINLIELSNPNHPLLRKLLIETPGTYHHSIIVGNLAESAAEAIGANGLLARVGAYYHDLGKTKRPTFFIENQLNKENPHDKIAPNLSKNIILAHPKDGVEMLREYKLPLPIQEIALQHHGTSLLKYFYHKVNKDNENPVPESEYRYQGPKPQTKEAAIVCIADSVEAAVRSIQRPTNELIETTVRKIIKAKLDDNQFNECDLTLKELDIVANSMLESMKGIFHSRIEYPDDKELEALKGEKTS